MQLGFLIVALWDLEAVCCLEILQEKHDPVASSYFFC